MSFNKVMFSSAHDNWSTPKDTYEALDKEFKFNDDPCPIGGGGGLDREWGTSTFVNPPYSEIAKWIAYGYAQAQRGRVVVMLIPSRTDTRWWHDYCMKAKAIAKRRFTEKMSHIKINTIRAVRQTYKEATKTWV